MSQSASQPGLWNFGGLSARELARRLWRGYSEHQISAFSAQFEFYAMLALAPMLILVIAAIAHQPLEGMLGALERVLGDALPESSYRVLENQLRDLYGEGTPRW